MRSPSKRAMVRLPFFLAKRFVAGETIAAALAAVRRLNAEGFLATLDFLGEHVTQAADAQATHATYLTLLDTMREANVQANISVKLSALGLLVRENLCTELLTDITEHAQANPDPFVRIDMEGSAFTQKTLEIFEHVHARLPNVGPVIQASLKRSPDDIERLLTLGARVRLCKGAYREPATIAHRDMPTIRRVYLRLAEALLSRGVYPGIATHDEHLIQAVIAYTGERGIPPDRFEFQMLHGVRPERKKSLVAAGYRVRVYVPFGQAWAPYFARRIAERRENLLFALQAVFLK